MRLSGLEGFFRRLVDGSCGISGSFFGGENVLVERYEFVGEVEVATVCRLFSKILFH